MAEACQWVPQHQKHIKQQSLEKSFKHSCNPRHSLSLISRLEKLRRKDPLDSKNGNDNNHPFSTTDTSKLTLSVRFAHQQ
jgi:hypothetical protein